VNDPPSGQNFGHSERRQGDDTTGTYFVLLPDGRLQRVEYTAGVGGYRARVSTSTFPLSLAKMVKSNFPNIDFLQQ